MIDVLLARIHPENRQYLEKSFWRLATTPKMPKKGQRAIGNSPTHFLKAVFRLDDDCFWKVDNIQWFMLLLQTIEPEDRLQVPNHNALSRLHKMASLD